MRRTNHEIDQDRVFDLLDTFEKHGCIMFAQQRAIYNHLAKRLSDSEVLEAGCGNGVGTAILSQRTKNIIGTDKSARNVKFAKCLYPWLPFEQWDINSPIELRAQCVVCVEAFEHIENPEKAMQNLIDASIQKVWISTPNGTGKERPPENPYHVCEYTPEEMLDMVPKGMLVTIRDGESWDIVDIDTKADPLIYEVTK
jgi:2-polyprenyl-3-methyl-5-hydroxy-6-metoxy-1,4-benzoquinol methylase